MERSYVVNVADAPAWVHPIAGITIELDKRRQPFRDTGINIIVLEPGQPSCKYHSESVQEDFLVLGGECITILDGEERTLGQWDFLHCEPGAAHVFVGAGDGPCWILQIGARREGSTIDYPANPIAAEYGAATPTPTDDGDVAYSDWPHEGAPVTPPWPPQPGATAADQGSRR
jgi:uncharacterized cupin superfamily protein